MRRRKIVQKGALSLLIMLGAVELCANTSDDYIELIHACRVGNVEGVREGLDKGIDVNRTDRSGWTPLFHAAVTGHLPVVELLVERGADHYIVRSGTNETSLSSAVQSGNSELIRYLLDQDAERMLNLPRPFTDHPVITALILDNREALQLFREYGVDYTKWSTGGVTALTVAAQHTNLDSVRYLLQAGMDPNRPNLRGNHVLSLAAFRKRPDLMSLLLDAGADPNAISSGTLPITGFRPSPHTALANAVLENDPATVQLLLEEGADPSLLDHRAIKFADMVGNQELYTLLLNHGAHEPPPYSFARMDLFRHAFRDDPSRAAKTPEVDWGLHSVLNRKATRQRPETDRERDSLSIAVLSQDGSPENAGALLATGLSQTPGYTVLERQQIDRLAQEHTLQQVFMMQAEHSIQAGELLGVDALALIEEDDQAITASLIAVSTGLVLDTMVYAPGTPPDTVADDFHTRIENVAHLLDAPPDDFLLLSIPYITGLQTDEGAGAVQKRLSNALAIHLGAQENTYILERNEMRRLAVEQALQGGAREFYASGWLIDGSFEIARDDAETLTVVLRLRQPGADDEIVISESAALRDVSSLLKTLTREILAGIRDTPAVEVNVEEEARAYFEQAQRAYRANLWEYAHLSADAAWVLGKRSERVTDLLLRSIIHRIRVGRQRIQDSKIDSRVGWSKTFANRAPLLLPKTSSHELSAEDYLNLADDILDIYQPLLQKEGDFTSFELDLLAFYPIALRAAVTPAIYLQSLSDRRTYGTRLDPLVNRMRRQTLRARALAKQNDHAVLYQFLTLAYVEHLPRWIEDEDAIHDEVLEIFREANRRDPPYVKHKIYHGCREIMRPRLNSITDRANSTWSRIVPRLAKSEIPEVALLGNDLMRFNTGSAAEKYRLMDTIVELLLEIVPQDDSMSAGLARYWLNIPEDLTLRGSFRDSPKFMTRGLWFPCPLGTDYWSTRSAPPRAGPSLNWGRERIEATKKWSELQINAMAEQGKPTTLRHLRPDPDVFSDPETVKRLIDRLYEAHRKIEIRCETSGFFPEWPQWFMRSTLHIRRFEARLEELKEVEKEPVRVVLELDNFRIPFHHVDDFADRMPFTRLSHLLTSSRESHFWLGWGTVGFQKYNLDAEPLETVILPRDYRMYSSLPRHKTDIGDRYIVTWLLRRGHGVHPTRIGVYDRKDGTWELFPVPELEYSPRDFRNYGSRLHGIHELYALGDHIVYSYITHPDPDLRNVSRQQRWNDPDTVKGISCLNIHTGEHTSLVNHRRTPSQSPLDDFSGDLYELRVLDDNSILSEGYVYNLAQDEWVKATGREKPRPYTMDGTFHVSIEGGSAYTKSVDNARNPKDRYTVNVYTGGNRTRRECVLTLVTKDWSELEIPADWTRAQRTYDDMGSFPVLHIDAFRHGLLLKNSLGFYFVPTQRFSDTLKHALEVQHE